MSDRNKLQRKRISFADRNSQRLDRKIRGQQSRLYAFTFQLIAGFAVDETGRLLFNVSNVNKARKVGVQLSARNKQETKGLLGWMFRRMLDLFGFNKGYFRSFEKPNQTAEERALRVLMLQYGYDINSQKIVESGYLSAISNSDVIALQVSRYINQSLAARVPMNQFKKGFRQLFLNPGKTGLLERHFERFTRDIFQQFDRSVQLQLAQELGLKHFIYAGTIMKKTRDFCEERNNKIYTIEEAQKWNQKNWKGKIPDVNFFIQAGGYNCRHHLNFISEEIADRIAPKRGGVNSFNELQN
jgi:hypothetical protein